MRLGPGGEGEPGLGELDSRVTRGADLQEIKL